MTAAIRIRHITNGLVTLIPVNLRDRLSRPYKRLRVLAREVGAHQVTVNEVASGWIITDRDRRWVTQVQPAYEERIPLRRRGFDQDVANAVAFLASDLAAFISGVCLPVCGGNVMSD